MASPWVNTFETPPSNNQNCIIRVPYYYGAPVNAFYRISAQPFIIPNYFEIGLGAGLWIPFYLVPRWKPA